MLNSLPATHKNAKKVDEVLIELGVGTRPMATPEVHKAFTKLQSDIVTMLDLQKQVTQKEYQLRLLRERHQKIHAKPDSLFSVDSPSNFLSYSSRKNLKLFDSPEEGSQFVHSPKLNKVFFFF